MLNLAFDLLREIEDQNEKKQWKNKINQLLDELECTLDEETFEKIMTLCDLYEMQNFETFQYFTKHLLHFEN